MTRISDMTALNELPAAGAFAPVEVPGSTGNWRYDLSKLAWPQGLFVNASGFTLPAGVDIFSTTGYASLGVGGANYVYDAAVDAAYVTANPRSSFMSANSRGFRLDREQDITPQMLGAPAEDATDAAPGIMAMVADAKAHAITGHQYGNAGGKMAVPKGAPAYRLSSTIDVDIAARFEAEGTGYGPGIWATILHPDPGVTAVRIQSWNTNGDSGTDAGDLFTGSGSLFTGFTVLGRYNGSTNLESLTAHGWHLRGTGTLRDGGVSDMQGDGVHIHASIATAGIIGNANGWEVSRFFIQNCTNGLSTKGSDSNAGMAILLSASNCRAWGFKNESGAGNIYLACSTQLCGTTGVGTAANPSAMVHRTGNHYAVRVGQEAWCSTNAPSGTTLSNTGWIWFEAGGIVNPGCVDWFNGMVCRAGGSFNFVTAALGIGLYWEGNQPPPQFSGDSIILGGTWGSTPVGGATINANSNQLHINDLVITGGGLTTVPDVGGALSIGRVSSGNPSAQIGPNSTASSLVLKSPDNSGKITITNSELDLYSVYVLTTNLNPFTDNAVALGGSGHRFTELWAASATIQTSDRAHKSNVRKLSGKQFAALLDAVGAVPLVAFKFKDAVKAKGRRARDHYGIIAQDLHDELVMRGLDPFAGGMLGRDPVLEEVEEEVEVEREAMRMEYQYEDQTEVVDGKAIRRKVLVEKPEPDFDYLPVHDEDGNPVIIPARPPRKSMTLIDGEMSEIEIAGTPERPMMHPVRRKEIVKEKQTVARPKLGKDGNPELIWNVRYAEFEVLHAAFMRREFMRKRPT